MDQSTESPILFRSCGHETPFSDQKGASKIGDSVLWAVHCTAMIAKCRFVGSCIIDSHAKKVLTALTCGTYVCLPALRCLLLWPHQRVGLDGCRHGRIGAQAGRIRLQVQADAASAETTSPDGTTSRWSVWILFDVSIWENCHKCPKGLGNFILIVMQSTVIVPIQLNKFWDHAMWSEILLKRMPTFDNRGFEQKLRDFRPESGRANVASKNCAISRPAT
jgi:hypothetical protein